MKHAFITLLNMSISGGFLILVVLLFRAVFKKVPRSVVLILWAVVALRLLVPLSFGSRLSILPGGSILPENVGDGERFQVSTGYGSIDQLLTPGRIEPAKENKDSQPGPDVDPVRPVESDPVEQLHGGEAIQPGTLPVDDPYVAPSGPEPVPGNDPVSAATSEDPLNVIPDVQQEPEPEPAAREPLFGVTKTDRVYRALFFAWLAGVAGMAIYLLVSCIVLLGKTRTSKKIGDRVYAADHISTAFLFGIFRPRIYLPSGITEDEAHFVILHEEAHLRRGDHLSKLLGFIVLILHWFNPLVWIAYFCFSKDLEFSCDERVVRNCSEEERVRYSETMLALSSKERIVFAHPVAFGEGNLKSRVKRVLRYRKPAVSLTILAVVLALVLSACLFTHRTEGPAEDPSETESESSETESETEPETEEPDPEYVAADVPEMKALRDLGSGTQPIGEYDYSRSDFVQQFQVDGYRLNLYEGSTEDAYCFYANRLSDECGAMVFFSKADGSLLKAVMLKRDDGWAPSLVSFGSGKILAIQSKEGEGSLENKIWHRRVAILDDEGKTKKVLFQYDEKSGAARTLVSINPIGNKLVIWDLPESLYSDPEKLEAMEREEGTVTRGRVLKFLDIKTGEIETIHEGDQDVRTNYQVLGPTERYPNGILYTVVEDLNFELTANDEGAITGYRCIRQNTLYYYQYADRKSYPVLESRYRYSFDLQTDTQTVSDNPLWDMAVGDLQGVILYGQPSGLFAAVDLEKGTKHILDKTDDYKTDADFAYHSPRAFYRTGEGSCVVEGSREILEGDVNLSRFYAYRVLNDDPLGEKYVPLRVADPEKLTAFYVDRSLGTAYLYDFRNTEPELIPDALERRKEIARSLDFSTPGDAFTEEEKEWIREYVSLFLERSDVSENDRISDSVKARWRTVTKLPYEQYETEYLFGDIRLRYDDGETAAVEYYLTFASPTGASGSNSNLLLLKRIDGQWTTAAHAVEIMPEYGPEVFEIGMAVREAAKKHHGALTDNEIEEGKRAAIDYIVNERIPGLSKSDQEAVRSYLHAEYIPEIYDKVLETDREFTLGGYLLIRPLPYFYVTVYADAENLPENVRNAIGYYMGEYEGRYERILFVTYDTEFHVTGTGSFVDKPIVLRGEEEAFLKIRNAIAESSDGELKYKLVKNAGEETEWKPLDFSKDRSASDGYTPIKQILSNMQASVQYPHYFERNYLWIADQNETWTLKLCDFSAILETEGHTYYYYVYASESIAQPFFMELMDHWEAEME